MNAKNEQAEQPPFQGNQTPVDICERLLAYAPRAIKLYRYLQVRKDGAGRVIGKQYLRAACSIGANVEEAQSAESRADFIHKPSIAQKEARESTYWLKLLSESQIVKKEKLEPLIQETKELLAVITAIIVSTKAHHALKETTSETKGDRTIPESDSRALNS